MKHIYSNIHIDNDQFWSQLKLKTQFFGQKITFVLLIFLLSAFSLKINAQTTIMDNTKNLGYAIDQYGDFWDHHVALIFTTNAAPYNLESVSMALYFYMSTTSDVTFISKLANASKIGKVK